MLWLQNSGINVSSDSKSWGNYRAATVTGITAYTRKTGWNDKTESWQTATGAGITKPGSTTESSDYMWLLKTGNTDYTKRKNIYDLAGNVWDWTNEIYSSYRVNRGGWFVNDGSDCPACYRSYTSITGTASSLGFRVGLYLT